MPRREWQGFCSPGKGRPRAGSQGKSQAGVAHSRRRARLLQLKPFPGEQGAELKHPHTPASNCCRSSSSQWRSSQALGQPPAAGTSSSPIFQQNTSDPGSPEAGLCLQRPNGCLRPPSRQRIGFAVPSQPCFPGAQSLCWSGATLTPCVGGKALQGPGSLQGPGEPWTGHHKPRGSEGDRGHQPSSCGIRTRSSAGQWTDREPQPRLG